MPSIWPIKSKSILCGEELSLTVEKNISDEGLVCIEVNRDFNSKCHITAVSDAFVCFLAFRKLHQY